MGHDLPWPSLSLMSLIDIALVGGFVAVLVLTRMHRRHLGNPSAKTGTLFLVLAMAALAAIYGADFVSMWVLPGLMGEAGAMDVMLHLHIEYAWYVHFLAFIMLSLGVGLVLRSFVHTARAAQSETERFADFAEISTDWFWETDAEHKYVWMSANVENVTGVPPEWHYGRSRREIGVIDQRDTDWNAHFAILDRREAYRDFVLLRRGPDGDKWIRSAGMPIFDENGVFKGYRGTGTDVTAEVQARLDLDRERDRFRIAVENMSDGIALFDSDGRLVLWNQAFEDFNPELAPNLVLAMSFEDMVRDNLRHGRIKDAIGREKEFLRERLARHRSPGEPLLSERTDGRWLMLREARLSDGSAILINTDLTALRDAEERLRRSQRMEAIGQLTGGIAHDFNNLLGVILGNAQLLERQTDDESFAEGLRRIVDMVSRGSALTSRLLAFARQQTLSPQTVVVSELIDDVQEMLARTLGAAIDVRVHLPGDLWPALIDPGQFENALLNLAINARDAMANGGELRIEAANVTLDADFAEGIDGLVPGDFIRIAVSDTGSGVAPANLPHVFEPFFTTKPVGEGSGLGLSMVYGFIKQSNGHVVIESEAGGGTTVTLYLPRSTRTETATSPAAKDATRGGGGCILVVEDDAEVRRIPALLLAEEGYRVIEARDGAQALAILDSGEDVDLLFTDIVLPGGINGVQLSQLVRQRRPGIKVLFTSGYAESDIFHDGKMEQGVDLLRKPYTHEDLLQAVDAALTAGKDDG